MRNKNMVKPRYSPIVYTQLSYFCAFTLPIKWCIECLITMQVEMAELQHLKTIKQQIDCYKMTTIKRTKVKMFIDDVWCFAYYILHITILYRHRWSERHQMACHIERSCTLRARWHVPSIITKDWTKRLAMFQRKFHFKLRLISTTITIVFTWLYVVVSWHEFRL